MDIYIYIYIYICYSDHLYFYMWVNFWKNIGFDIFKNGIMLPQATCVANSDLRRFFTCEGWSVNFWKNIGFDIFKNGIMLPQATCVANSDLRRFFTCEGWSRNHQNIGRSLNIF